MAGAASPGRDEGPLAPLPLDDAENNDVFAANSMSKNILIVSATPRKNGNSDLLCNEFMRGAEESGHHVEKIRLSEKNINYCTGCCTCVSKQGACVQQDDMNGIFAMILKADVMVLATPVYFHAMNGQMKTFIDRVCPIYTMVRAKEMYYILSAAGGKMPVDKAVQSLRLFTECFSGIKEKETIAVTGVWDAGEVNKRALEQAYAAGKNA